MKARQRRTGYALPRFLEGNKGEVSPTITTARADARAERAEVIALGFVYATVSGWILLARFA
jgi:hypothetical protein